MRTVIRYLTSVALLAASLACAATASADESQVQAESFELSDDELRAIEEALASDAADDAAPAPASSGSRAVQSMNPNIALILDVAGAWYSENDSLQLGAHDPVDTGFNLQQLELHLDASVDPFFRLDANLVFSLFGVELEEAFATATALPGGFQMRIGQFLTQFGRLNPTHPHAWSFVDQSLVNGKFFGGEGSRGLGVELSWLMPLSWYAELVTSVNNADGECCARSFYGADNPGVDGPEDLLVTTALKQFFDLSFDTGLLLGLSGQFGPNASGHLNRTNIFGADLTLRYKPVDSPRRAALTWQTEFLYRARQVPDESLQDWGLASSLVWRLSPRWELGARYEWVEGVDDDPLDPEWTAARDRTSLQATFFASHFSRLRLQGKYDSPDWAARPVWGAVLAAEFMIGAHGAHEY
jgi:hypothetical protein